MKNPKLLQERQEVDALFQQIQIFDGDAYYAALMTYYLCIRVSGFVENCVRIILTEYCSSRAQGCVRAYVDASLARLPNPTFGTICDLARKFDAGWRDGLKSSVDPKVKESLDSINKNRNSIAHGGTSTITISQLDEYYADVVSLIDELETTCT